MSGGPHGFFERCHQLAPPTVGLDMCRLKQLNLYEVGLPAPPAQAVADAFAYIKPSAGAYLIENYLKKIFRQVPLKVTERREECFSVKPLDMLSGDQVGNPIASSKKAISQMIRRQKIGGQKLDMAIMQASYDYNRTIIVEMMSIDRVWMPHVRAYLKFSSLITLDRLEGERAAGNKRWLSFWTKVPPEQDRWTEVTLHR